MDIGKEIQKRTAERLLVQVKYDLHRLRFEFKEHEKNLLALIDQYIKEMDEAGK